MPVRVTNECGKLRRVLLHRPGQELNQLTPVRMEELLFGDLPFLKEAQREHDAYADRIRSCGAEVLYIEALAAEALRRNPSVKEQFLDDFICQGGLIAEQYHHQLKQFFLELEDEKKIVEKAICGVRYEECEKFAKSSSYEIPGDYSRYLLEPLPNLYFIRDLMIPVGDRVCLGRMKSRTRMRESIFMAYIMKYHPDYEGDGFCYREKDLYFIEGGDILNLSNRVIAVGLSQRTTPEAVELLAKRLFADPYSNIETVLALDVPHIRSNAHLDAVITQVDGDKFMVYPGILGGMRIYEITPGAAKGSVELCELDNDLGVALATHMGLEKITLIQCGGRERQNIEREYWNFGSSVLCVQPGKVISYDRNQVTNETLRSYRVEVLEIPSYELSRGNGGPHSMAVPLEREESLSWD